MTALMGIEPQTHLCQIAKPLKSVVTAPVIRTGNARAGAVSLASPICLGRLQ